jgi:hypothetical protein
MRAGSALFKHEVAYVLGQMQNPNVVRAMQRVRVVLSFATALCP